jgi:hypothetical protein
MPMRGKMKRAEMNHTIRNAMGSKELQSMLDKLIRNEPFLCDLFIMEADRFLVQIPQVLPTLHDGAGAEVLRPLPLVLKPPMPKVENPF